MISQIQAKEMLSHLNPMHMISNIQSNPSYQAWTVITSVLLIPSLLLFFRQSFHIAFIFTVIVLIASVYKYRSVSSNSFEYEAVIAKITDLLRNMQIQPIPTFIKLFWVVWITIVTIKVFSLYKEIQEASDVKASKTSDTFFYILYISFILISSYYLFTHSTTNQNSLTFFVWFFIWQIIVICLFFQMFILSKDKLSFPILIILVFFFLGLSLVPKTTEWLSTKSQMFSVLSVFILWWMVMYFFYQYKQTFF